MANEGQPEDFTRSYYQRRQYYGLFAPESPAGIPSYAKMVITILNGVLGLIMKAGGSISFDPAGNTVSSGTGTPEGALTAPKGSLFLRTDGGAGTTLYVKESGTGNTGWVGK